MDGQVFCPLWPAGNAQEWAGGEVCKGCSGTEAGPSGGSGWSRAGGGGVLHRVQAGAPLGQSRHCMEEDQDCLCNDRCAGGQDPSVYCSLRLVPYYAGSGWLCVSVCVCVCQKLPGSLPGSSVGCPQKGGLFLAVLCLSVSLLCRTDSGTDCCTTAGIHIHTLLPTVSAASDAPRRFLCAMFAPLLPRRPIAVVAHAFALTCRFGPYVRSWHF